jgi:hypothetical protein
MCIKKRQAAVTHVRVKKAGRKLWPRAVARVGMVSSSRIWQAWHARPFTCAVKLVNTHAVCEGVRADLQKERLKALVKSAQKKHINHTPHAHPQSPAQFLRGDNTVKIAVGLGARSARSRWGGNAAYTCCGVWVASVRFACRRESDKCANQRTHGCGCRCARWADIPCCPVRQPAAQLDHPTGGSAG